MKTSKEPSGIYSTQLDLPMRVIIPFLILFVMVIWFPVIWFGYGLIWILAAIFLILICALFLLVFFENQNQVEGRGQIISAGISRLP